MFRSKPNGAVGQFAHDVLTASPAPRAVKAEPMLYKIHALRFELGLPRHPFWGIGSLKPELFALPQVSHLEGFEETDLCTGTQTLDVPDIPSFDQVDPSILARSGALNQLYLDPDFQRKPVELLEFRDVFLAQAGARYVIFGPWKIDKRASALPSRRLFEAMKRGQIRTMDHAFYCGDRFIPNNPAHALGDHLARAVYARDTMGLAPAEIVLPQSGAPVVSTMQEEVDPGFTILPQGAIIHAKRLTLLNGSVARQAGGHPLFYANPHVTATIADAAARVASRGVGFGKRIYLSRRTMGSRPLRNEADLIAALEAVGFTSLTMETLDGETQMAAIAQADIIVAPHGAALSTILAARPGTKCLEMFHPQRGVLDFCIMAALRGVDYDMVVGQALEDGAWEIDADAILARLPPV